MLGKCLNDLRLTPETFNQVGMLTLTSSCEMVDQMSISKVYSFIQSDSLIRNKNTRYK